MKQVSQKLYGKLTKISAPVCISMYTPLDNDSPEALKANKIRIKNIISEIKKVNEESGQLHIKDIDKHLSPLEKLMDSRGHLWQRSAKSLAVFVSEDVMEYAFLPTECDQKETIISNTFYLEPVEKLAKESKPFYLLSASYNKVELFYGDQFHLEPVELDSLPNRSAEEVLGIDEYPQSQQFHPATTTSAPVGKHNYREQFHGQYEETEESKKLIRKYFRIVDEAVSRHLQGKRVPLLFAGVNYLFPLYAKQNSYKYLKSKPIEGNFQNANLQELHKRALQHI